MQLTINPIFIALLGFCFTLLSALVGIGVFWGSMKTQITALFEAIARLERKQDKYNNLQERLAKVEARAASNTHRINKIDK